MSSNNKLEWANYWESQGFSVIPVHYVRKDGSCSCSMGKDCTSKGKHPAPKSWKEFQTKKADPNQLKQWFDGQYKDFNLGVVTGKVSGNVFAVDIDIGEGKEGADNFDDLQMANDDLPQTLEQRTGSGGKHLFFKAPDGLEMKTDKNTLGGGIDTRGEGGFVVVAPSNHKSGSNYNLDTQVPHIEESPDWLTKLTVNTAPSMNGSASLQSSQTDKWGDLVDGREGYMVQLLIGTIRTFWTKKGIIPTVQQLVEEAYPTYENKCRARGRSLEEDGRGKKVFEKKANYLLWKARKNELRILQDVEKGSEISQQTEVVAPLHDQLRDGARSGSPELSSPLILSDWNLSIYSGEAPEQEWLIENILPRRIPGLVAAVGGLGKSFILLDLAMKVAGGDQGMHKERALGGDVITNGKVVFLTAEDSKDGVHRRLRNIAGASLFDRANGNLIVVPLPDAGGAKPLIQNTMGQYTTTAIFEDIRSQLIEMGDVALIIFDPLQAFAAADINTDPAAAQFWWSNISELCVATGANVLVAHHMRKEGTFSIKKSVHAREAIRGTTALVDGARWVYGLWQMPESDEVVVAQKMDFESGVGNCVMGGIVKVNDQADNTPRAFIRDESGLLIDRTIEVDTILEQSAKLDKLQTTEIFSEINRRWGTEEPFSIATNTTRSLQAYLLSEYGMPRRAAKGYIEAWQQQNFIENAVHDSSKKTKGVRVVRTPDER